ncbi:MAG: FUSC family protein [Bifidobacteriaceae bacterium]|jgi:uncharacterized membrane protein|nr:FUSC family protein [Bifidobacteriaceae bacterium]
MIRYRIVARAFFAVVFICGGLVHLVLGRVDPDSYAAFAETALFGWLGELWVLWVMPNIGWLTIVLGIFEIAMGLGMTRRRTVPIAAWGIMAFLIFITAVGYGFPTDTPIEDFFKNRIITIVMGIALLPLFTRQSRRRAGGPRPAS